MLVAGGLFPILLAFAQPNSAPLLTSTLGTLAVVIGLGCLARPQRVPRWLLMLLPPFGTALIGLSTWLDSTAGDGGELLYIWPVLLAAYYLSMRAGLMNVVLIAAVHLPVAISMLGPLGVTSSVYLFGTLVVTVLIVSSLRRQLARVLADSDREARTDRLTGLTNRRGWDEDLARMVARQRADGAPLSLIMIDLDHFKRLNDTFGHAAGDAALANVATVLRTGVRPGDVLARIGGEEIVLLLPGRSADRAVAVADRLRERVEQDSRDWPTPVTVSIGVAALTAATPTAESMQHAADQALYVAKRAGRNRVISALDVTEPIYRSVA